MELTKSMMYLSWFLRIVAAVILLQTLFFKFTGAAESVYIFSTLGMEPWGRIGSGVAEGACRHLVKDRLERTGMRWTVPGAQALLHLRAIYLNGDWDDYLEYHIQTEQATQYAQKAA